MLPETTSPDLLEQARLKLVMDQYTSRYTYFLDALDRAYHEAEDSESSPLQLAYLRLMLEDFSNWLEELLRDANYNEGESGTLFDESYEMWLLAQMLLGSDHDDLHPDCLKQPIKDVLFGIRDVPYRY